MNRRSFLIGAAAAVAAPAVIRAPGILMPVKPALRSTSDYNLTMDTRATLLMGARGDLWRYSEALLGWQRIGGKGEFVPDTDFAKIVLNPLCPANIAEHRKVDL